MSAQQHYREAAGRFADLVAHPGARWDAPALGVWDLRALVGHTCRALLTVESYLRQPADREEIDSAAAYYLAAARVDHGLVAERGRAAGAALGEDPAGSVRVIVDRVLGLLPEDDPLLTTIAGGMRLSRYLPTRTFELVVHGTDIAAALGVEPPPWSDAVLREVAEVAASAAVLRGHGVELIRALTGRARLPEGFSVV